MKLRPFAEKDFPFFLSLKCNSDSGTFDFDKPIEIGMICTNEDEPLGFMAVFDAVPEDKGEFGIDIPDPRGKMQGKIILEFMQAVFDKYHLRLLYCNPIDETARKRAERFGFVNDVLTYEQFKNKWSRKRVDKHGSRSSCCRFNRLI